jgi:hypothetical protein
MNDGSLIGQTDRSQLNEEITRLANPPPSILSNHHATVRNEVGTGAGDPD